ncbi:type I phosphomannose isomerase catalytic subunit [Spongiivirga sp. MCCC 1A20706]|uniref:type I phosphomannose isomerase catalytic subunit n=1 Tax=Spongiivirga sp. MCCC 1A20706 TaxID=3160963 RepID=UPI00397782FD
MLDYPIKFEPILQDKIWGGKKLQNLLNKETDLDNIGESWEISGVNSNISIVSNGYLKGKSLIDLIANYKGQFVGEKVYRRFGNNFPLLIKFIDAKEDLSVQLHPNDELAKERHDSFGKTEMWVVMQADEEANLIVDFNRKVSKEEYSNYLSQGKITEILNFENVNAGDSFFISEGIIHAIGAGVLLAEIQQTSDITYRVYDWDRVDKEGNSRELHTELALDALNFERKDDFRKDYNRNRESNIAKCQYFTTNFLPVSGRAIRVLKEIDSFKIFICLKGAGTVAVRDKIESFEMGETFLIPACTEQIVLDGNTELLEVYV